HAINVRSKEGMTLRLNPLKLTDSAYNREFLRNWMHYLLADDPKAVSDADRRKIAEAVEYLFTLEERSRNLTNILPKFWPLGESAPAAPAQAAPPPPQVEKVAEAADPSMEEMAKTAGKFTLTMEEIAAQQQLQAEA